MNAEKSKSCVAMSTLVGSCANEEEKSYPVDKSCVLGFKNWGSMKVDSGVFV